MRRELVRAAQGFAKSLDPMRLERTLQLRDERTFHADHQVAPMFRVLRVAGPLLRETNRAGERDLAVDHENAAMRAAICPVDPPRMQRVIVGKFAARFLQHFHVGVIELPTGADAVEQHAHFLAGPRAFAKCVAKRMPDTVRINNVSLEVNRLLRAMNRGQHRGEITVAIFEQVELVPVERDRRGQRKRRAEEGRIAHAEGVLEMIFEHMPANEEDAEDCEDGEKGEARCQPFRHLEIPPFPG